MTDSDSPALSWVCPVCGRQVPRRFTECRCGCAQPDARPAGTSSGPEGASGARWKSALRSAGWVGGALVAVVLAVALLDRARPDPAQRVGEPAPTPDTSQPAATVASPPAAAEPATTPETTSAGAAEPDATALLGSAPLHAPDAPAVASLEDVISRAMPAIVRVETGAGTGSGFFVAPDTVLSNAHVVGSNSSVAVRQTGGASLSARVALTAPDFDIAVLKLTGAAATQPTLAMGSTSGLRVGQEVVAVGSALGVLQNTVTRGIVSGIRQTGAVTLVQTDAAINPGNSGGPLLDRNGNVVGITTMRVSGGAGLGFAVAIDHARALLSGTVPAAPAAGTPAGNLNRLLSAPPAAMSADQAREQATRAYGQTLADVARQADGLDVHWRRFTSACYQGRINGVFDREWFAVWDPRAMQGAVSPGCGAAFDDLRQTADDVRRQVLAAEEAARQADVYPGARRELRRKYRLEYAGWDR